MKYLITLLILVAGPLAMANEFGDYLELGDTDTLEAIHGDASEDGFAWTSDPMIFAVENVHFIPIPNIEIHNDSAGCTGGEFFFVQSMEEMGKVANTNKTTWKIVFRLEVRTEINADTGGCMAIVKMPEEAGIKDRILKVIDYTYTSRY